MIHGNLQLQLFNFIKIKIDDHLNVVDEIAKVLDISSDSAYRRMRGEKAISIDELYALCSHYRLSLDQLVNVPTDNIIFQGSYFDRTTFNFDQYLGGILHTLAYYN